MFRCNNSVCVESKHLCDYSDDCGDRTDEDNCGEISQRPWKQRDLNLEISTCSVLEQSKWKKKKKKDS